MWLFWNAIIAVITHDDTINTISMLEATLKCLQTKNDEIGV